MSDTTADDAQLLLGGLRALIRTQQVAERADVACCGMTVAQAATIHILHLEGPMRLGPLSRRLGIATSTLTRNVERAEAGGLVERVADPEDGRAIRLRLTATGRRRAREIEDQNRRSARQLLEALPADRRERVIGGLFDLLEAIDRTVGDSCPEQFKPIRDFLEARTAVTKE